MAFAYSTALQDRIAYAVWNVANSSLSAAQKVQLDLTWTTGSLAGGAAYDAYIEVSQVAQWFEQASSTPDLSFAQPAWNRLFVAKAAMLLVKTVRPDRLAEFVKDHESALDQCIDTFTRDLVSSTSLAGQGINLSGIRAYVIDHCVKRVDTSTGLRRRLFPSIAQIGGHIQWTLNFVANMKPWHFRKRQVTMTIATASLTTATWTESTKTLTQTGAFTNTNIGLGSRLLLTSGTGALTGEYVISSRTNDDAIVLENSISSAAANLTTGDIVANLQIVTLAGMNSGETFDSIVSRKFFYDGTYYGNTLDWVDASDMARRKASSGTNRYRPQRFRWEKYGSGITWHLAPFPDTSYTLRGAVTISSIGTLTDSTSLDTAIAKFPTEFGTVIRDVVLARTLSQHGASDGDLMMKSAIAQCESLLPVYSDQGFPTRQTSVEDVYEDYAFMQRDRPIW